MFYLLMLRSVFPSRILTASTTNFFLVATCQRPSYFVRVKLRQLKDENIEEVEREGGFFFLRSKNTPPPRKREQRRQEGRKMDEGC